jgi:hypothetical protein
MLIVLDRYHIRLEDLSGLLRDPHWAGPESQIKAKPLALLFFFHPPVKARFARLLKKEKSPIGRL